MLVVVVTIVDVTGHVPPTEPDPVVIEAKIILVVDIAEVYAIVVVVFQTLRYLFAVYN